MLVLLFSIVFFHDILLQTIPFSVHFTHFFFLGGGGQQLYVRVNKQKIKMKVEQLAEIIGDGLLTSKYYD